MTSDRDQAVRICPQCNASDPIGASEPLWAPERSCGACGWRPRTTQSFPLFAPELADMVFGVDPAGFSLTLRAEAGHFWFVNRNRLLTGLIDRHFPGARSYLEVGCGNGSVLQAVSVSKHWDRLVGIELHPTGLASARMRLGHRAELLQADAARLPARGLFDVVAAFDVLEHIDDDGSVLEQLHDALAPGGGLVLSVPQHPWLWSGTDEIAHHVRRYRRGELEGKARAAGFDVVASTSYTSLLLPLMVASRLVPPPLRSGRPAHEAEFGIGDWTNRVFGTVTRFEVSLALLGVSWPVGGSRIVVARRRDRIPIGRGVSSATLGAASGAEQTSADPPKVPDPRHV